MAQIIPATVPAQATSGVTGVVTDESGAVVVGVKVTLTNPATSFSASTTTNSEGAYKFLNIVPATYRLSFSKDTFRTVTVSNVELGVAVTETRNATLAVGNTTETIEVTASGEGTVNTVDASIGNVITTKQIQDLPTILRDDATAVLQLQPGVQSAPNSGNSQFGSVTGSRADTGTVTLDGLDVNDETIGLPFAAVGRAPVDSIAEVRTIVGGADATFGRSAGAQVDLVTMSGSNHWHGTLSEFNRVSVEAANDYFNNLSGQPRAQLTRNQYGGSVGGPILKDKLFFFFDYAARRQAQGAQQVLTVPTDAFRAGELSYINLSGNLATLPALGPAGSQSVQGLDPAGIGADGFSVRWTGTVIPTSTEPYTFYTVSDDGARLWIDGALVIDRWQDQSATEIASNAVSLTAGRPVSFRFEYYENGGGASAPASSPGPVM